MITCIPKRTLVIKEKPVDANPHGKPGKASLLPIRGERFATMGAIRHRPI